MGRNKFLGDLSIKLFTASKYSLRPKAHGAESRVTLRPFLADSAINTGIAVIVCPGGSYSWLDMKAEGVEVAEWLQKNGINAYLLKYRVATVAAYITGYRIFGFGNKYPDMLEDIVDALRYVYDNSSKDHIDTSMIGVMGFSAGGHLAMLSYINNNTKYKPHFLCPIYPVVTMSDERFSHKRSRRGALGIWGQKNEALQDLLSVEKHISKECPPVFLVNCKDDPIVTYQNSVLLDSALTASNVQHAYFQYKTGGHGFGASETKGSTESRQWKKEFLLWILNLKAQRK